jgi:hypothetical protein
MKNTYKTIAKLLLILAGTCHAQTSLADLKLNKPAMQALPDAVITQPATAPVVVQPAALPTQTLPTSPVAAPNNGVQIQKAPMALPQSPAQSNGINKAISPVDSLGSAKVIQLNNKKWEDVQNLPDSTVLVTPDGQRSSIGEVKKYKQEISKSNVVASPIAIKIKTVNLHAKNNNQSVDIKSILATENAAAASAITPAITGKDRGFKVDKLITTCNPCIKGVNGKGGSRLVFTPGTAESAAKYTIGGGGFGAKQGSVYLTGGFNKRPTLRVDSWRDDQITAYFEAGFTSEQDRTDVKLVVKLADGSLVESTGNAKFYATRAQTNIGLDKIPEGRINIDMVPNLSFSKTSNSYEFKQTGSTTYPRGWTDTINTKSQGWLKPGFEVVYADANIEQYAQDAPYVDSQGCAGVTRTIGESGLAWVGDNLQIKRPLNNISMHPTLGVIPAGASAAAQAVTNYLGLSDKKPEIKCTNVTRVETGYHSMVSNIVLVVEGPAGLSPF